MKKEGVQKATITTTRTTAAVKDEIERKVTLVTEGFTTSKISEAILRDRNRLSRDNALTVCDYIIAMKREVNPRVKLHKIYNPISI